MNLALGAIIISILLLPPLIILHFYRNGAYARASAKLSLIEYLLISAIFSLFIHCIAILFITYCLKMTIDFVFIFGLVTGNLTSSIVKEYKDVLQKYLIDFGLYTFSLATLSFLFGLGFRWISTRRKFRMLTFLQRKRDDKIPDPNLRYFSHWWYFFRANEYSRDYSFLGSEIASIFIDVIVDTKDSTVIYSGLLKDFVTNEENLERVYLTNVSKRIFSTKQVEKIPATQVSARETSSENFSLKEGAEHKIPGHLFCIPYSKISNINLRFAQNVVRHGADLLDEAQSQQVLSTAIPPGAD